MCGLGTSNAGPLLGNEKSRMKDREDRATKSSDGTDRDTPLFRREAQAHATRDAGDPLFARHSRAVIGGLADVIKTLLATVRHLTGFLALAKRRRIPFVPQMEVSDCGAACLAMAASANGIPTTLDRVRTLTTSGRDGISAGRILEASRHLGLVGRAIRADIDQLVYLPAGSILHWKFGHFVVLERVGPRDTVDIVDPAFGRRRVGRRELDRSYTGVAITFVPGARRGERGVMGVGVRSFRDVLFVKPQLWVRVLVFSVALQVFALIVPAVARWAVDATIASERPMPLGVLVGSTITVAAVHVLLGAVRSTSLVSLQTETDLSIGLRVVRHLLDLPYLYVQARSLGDLFARVRSIGYIRRLFTSGVVSSAIDVAVVGVYIVVVARADLLLAGVVAVIAIIQLGILLANWSRVAELAALSLEAQGRAQGHLIQLLYGIEFLKASGREDAFFQRWSAHYVDEINAEAGQSHQTAVADALVATIRVVGPLAVLLFGLQRVSQGAMSVGEAVAINAVAALIVVAVGSLVTTALHLASVRSYLARILDLLSTPSEDAAMGTRMPASVRGDIQLQEVEAGYGGASVLRGVSLHIKAGDKIAVVGASGSGKSTLALTLASIIPPTSGLVRFDGINREDLDLHALRREVSVVPQRAWLFGGTIWDNMTFLSPTSSLADVRAAADAVGLDREIMGFPMGYNTTLSDGGLNLSGGQRQRIALVRAILGEPAVLILDEATSAVDPAAEVAILKRLAALPCTMIVVTHRLTLIGAKRHVIVMEDGRVAVEGEHSDVATSEAYVSLSSPRQTHSDPAALPLAW